MNELFLLNVDIFSFNLENTSILLLFVLDKLINLILILNINRNYFQL
jgi:hypothetical protein